MKCCCDSLKSQTLNRKDTVFDGGLFNPLQLRLHLFGVLTEVDALKTDRRRDRRHHIYDTDTAQ